MRAMPSAHVVLTTHGARGHAATWALLHAGETLLLLLKEFRPSRNTRDYLADVVEVTHVLLRLVKTFSEDNPHLQKLKKRRRTKRSKKKVEGKEGEGEWLGGEGSEMEELDDEVFEEVAFNFQTFMKQFVNAKVVEQYTWLISKYKHNTHHTNHQVLKMMDMIARKCNHLPLLFQASCFNVFEKILSESEADRKKEHKETVDFVRWVVREFFKLAMLSPCIFLEVFAWTRSHSDAEMIMRAYKPEERENKGRKGKKTDDDDLLKQHDGKRSKWTEDEDFELREFFEQFGHKRNAPEIIATLMVDKSKQQIANRLNKLGLNSTRGSNWSEDEDDDEEASLYVCARRLRNKAPAALDWVIDCYGLACEIRDKTIQVGVHDQTLPPSLRPSLRPSVPPSLPPSLPPSFPLPLPLPHPNPHPHPAFCHVQLTRRCTSGCQGSGTRFAGGIF